MRSLFCIEGCLRDIKGAIRGEQQSMYTDKPSKRHGLRHIVAAFWYSICGLRTALSETAIRHELILGAIHFLVLIVINPPFISKLVLTCLFGVLLVVEILNTAIETVVDIASPERSELAKRAKDLGSAAVFCALVVFLTGWAFTIWEATR